MLYGLEVRFIVRSLLRSKTYTIFSVLTLGGAIGATAAIFSILDAMLLRRLPYEDPDRIVMVWLKNDAQGYLEDVTSYPSYVDFRDSNDTLAALAAYNLQTYHLTGGGEPERLVGANVSPNFFPMLGVAPELGDYLSAETDFVFPDHRIVLSHALWQRRFGGRGSVVGERILLDGTPFIVVGVMPASFRIPEFQDFWTPLALQEDARTARHAFWLFTIGRLKRNVEIEEARADLEVVMRRIEREFFGSEGRMGVVVNRLHDQWVRDIRGGLVLLGAGVASLWLLACTNLAGIGLARGAARDDEIALRRTLGASGRRIVETLVGEGMLVGALAIPFALLLATVLTNAFVATAPAGPAGVPEPSVEPGTWVFAACLSVVSGVLLSLAPAIHASSRELYAQLRRGSGLRASGGSRQRSRRVLVVSEIALALVVLTGSMLLVRSFQVIQRVPVGLEVANLSRLNLTLPSHYDDDASIGRFYETVIDDLAALPGVERVAAASGFLGGTLSGASPFTIEGRAVDKNDIEAAFIASVSPGYFSTAGIPLLQGRDFDSGDDEDGARVVIVNRTMAEKYWPGVSPVGRRMAYGTNPDTETEWMTVVGVVGDVRQLGPDRGIRPKTFLPLRQNPTRFMTVLFRSPLSPESLFPAMREAIWQRDDRIPVAGVETVASILDERLAGRRHNTFVLGLFAGAAVFLAAIGVYGVLAYSVSQRSQELGVRMAFGARAWDVAMLVWKDGAALLAIGLVIGGLGLFPLKRLLAGLLFGVGPFDPLALMASSVLLALCAFVACAVPALRAATTDPVRALRE